MWCAERVENQLPCRYNAGLFVGSSHGGRGRLIRGGRNARRVELLQPLIRAPILAGRRSAWARSVDRSPGSPASRVSPASSAAPPRGPRRLRPSKPAPSPRSPTVPAKAVRGAELVVLAVPPAPTLDLIGRLAPSLESGAILTDVCSVKAPVMAAGPGLRPRRPVCRVPPAGRDPRLRLRRRAVPTGSAAAWSTSARPVRPRGAADRPRRDAVLGGRPGGAADPDRLPPRTTASSPGPATCRRPSRTRWPRPLADRRLGGVVLRHRRPGHDPPGREQSRHVAGYPAAKPGPVVEALASVETEHGRPAGPDPDGRSARAGALSRDRPPFRRGLDR